MNSLSIVLTALIMAISTTGAISQTPRIEYLSDSQHLFIFDYQGWGTLGIDVAAHSPNQSALPLQIGEKRYSKGLGHHAAGDIIIDLNGEYTAFEAEVGVQTQESGGGSVVFKVYVDDEERFSSGVMTGQTPPKQVKVSVDGAQDLRLELTDAGDGIICDCGNWAEARLVRAETPKPINRQKMIDIAPFGRTVSSDPARTDGCRSNRVEEYHADDIFMEPEIAKENNGFCTLPKSADGRYAVGIDWVERRLIRELGIEFAPDSTVPPTDGAQVQCWVGESLYQGKWVPLNGTISVEKDRQWIYRIDWRGVAEARSGVRKLRWIIPASNGSVRIKNVSAYSPTRWKMTDLTLLTTKPLTGRGKVEIYNGEITSGKERKYETEWDMSKPLRFSVKYMQPRHWKSDRTTIRLKLPGTSFAVAVDDVMANPRIYVKDPGVFITANPGKLNISDYCRKVSEAKTVLERVREMPDQTFEQAITKTHNPVQDNGPMLLSLSSDNRKFVVHRDGAVSFDPPSEAGDRMELSPTKYMSLIRSTFGSGKNEGLTRHLDGGWLPVPVISLKDEGLIYTQRSFVAPIDDEAIAGAPQWLKKRPACVLDYTIENPEQKAADASLVLSFIADAEKGQTAELRQTTRGADAYMQNQLLASVDTGSSSGLTAELKDGTLTLKGSLPAGSRSHCVVYLPGWNIRQDELHLLSDANRLLERTRNYWKGVMADAIKIEIPDPKLQNVIRAMQIHCLIAARCEDNGRRIAPWIAGLTYGPLESEAHSIVRGMDMLGHDEFAEKSLDFFIHRFNQQGFLTTGYTLMGTGWHLWTLGEHYQLTKNKSWMKQVAPEVDRVCNWIALQREKTKRFDASGNKVPEYGLMPPGIMADWNAFAYFFCLNAYYYAGLSNTADALSDISYPNAKKLTDSASDFRREILRGYRWTQSKMPVYPLKTGEWVRGYPSQLLCPGPTNDFFPAEDGNRSWCYDIELGAHQLVPTGVLDPNSPEVTEMMDHMEDVQFLSSGMGEYPAERNEADWFNLGGFAKVQPYYCRNAEIYAMRDEVKPFIRSYFNSLASLLNTEVLWHWEHFHNIAAWDKTHETGYFLQQTRFMFVMEHGDNLYLAPMVTNNWTKNGMVISVKDAPTKFGKTSYKITSSVAKGFIEAEVNPPTRSMPKRIVLRLRHPQGKQIKSVTVNGKVHKEFDPAKECIYIKAGNEAINVRAEY